MDERVRAVIFDVTMRDGTPPSVARVAAMLALSEREVTDSFRRLAEAHIIVLQRSGEILMAGPFSAIATPFSVTTRQFTAYANCIWDALGIPAMVESDASIETTCADCGEPAVIEVRNGEVVGTGFMHFALPARLWWLDIVFT